MAITTKRKKQKANSVKRTLSRVRKLVFSSSDNQKRLEAMTKRLLFIACLFGAAAVILGAFGAHVLKKVLTEADLHTYQTGVQYHFYHTFAILFTAILGRYASKKWTNIAGWLFAAGIVLFSGSLYLLSISYAFELEALNPILGPLTPIGGVLFIGGWLSLFFAATQYKERSSSGRSHSRLSEKSSRNKEEVN